MNLKAISADNRPRERLEQFGVSSLSNAELLAIILQKGSRDENVIDMANRLLSTFEFHKLGCFSLSEFKQIKGIGLAKACQISALVEFAKRFNKSGFVKNRITCAKEVFELLQFRFLGESKEHFIALLLDSKNRVLKEEVISVGTLNSSLVHPREVFKSAIKESANSLIIAHNHPSGDPAPSEEDKLITKVLFDSGKMLGIKVLDHVIIGDGKWFSFSDGL